MDSMISPRAKVLLLLMVGVLAITFENVLSLGFLTAASLVTIARSGVSRKRLKQGAFLVAAICWTTVFSQALFYADEPRTPWFTMGPLVFWAEGIEHGLVQSLRMISVSLAGLSLALSTPPDRILVALQRLGLPAGVCFLAITALRFIPVLAKEVMDVRSARAHRGRPMWQRSPWAWLMMEVRLLRPIVARTLRRARTLAESLHTRGYDATGARAMGDAPKWSRADHLALAAVGAFTITMVSGRIAFILYAMDIVYVPGLRSVYSWVRLWV